MSLSNTLFQNRLNILHGGTIASMVDLGGSLAVASMGLYSTGVSTDLNGEAVRIVSSLKNAYSVASHVSEGRRKGRG